MIAYRECIKPLSPYVPGKPIADVRREFDLEFVTKLASNENPYGCSEAAREAALRAMSEISLYPDGNCTELRAALAAKWGISPKRLVFGAGADEIISMICKVFSGEGDEVVTGSITFPQYNASATAMGAAVKTVPMPDLKFDLNAVLNAITPRTRVIFIANPNNPTGTVYTKSAQEEFLKSVPEDVVVVFDEAYGEFVGNNIDFPQTLSNCDRHPNVIWLKTFSKAYGLAGFRVGYAVCSEEIAALIEKIRNPFNVTNVAQAAALAALGDENFVAQTVRKNAEVREFVIKELNTISIECVHTEANFVLANFRRNSMELFAELMKRGYIARPTPLNGHLRVTFGTREQMEGFLKTLKEVI